MPKYILPTIILLLILLTPHHTSAYESVNFNYDKQQAGILSSLLSLLSPTSNAQTPDITTGLVGHWTFDEGSGTTAGDSSGSGNDGILTGDPAWTTGQIGDYALDFDGVDDYVETPIIDIRPWAGITISAWVNWQSIVNNEHTIISNHNPNDPGFKLQLEPDCGNCVEAWIITSLDTSTGAEFTDLTLVDDTWYHVAMTYDLATMKAYLNGQASSITPTGTGMDDSAVVALTNIGRNVYATGDYFDGLIDDVRVYNRALTQADITELYNYTGGPPPPTCTSFTYSEWSPSTCPINETQTRTITSSSPSGCTGGTPDPLTQSCTYTPPPEDTTPPSTPTNLTATAVSSSQINLTWTASTDNVAVTGYKIYRDGSQITTITGTSYSNTGLTAETTYTYTVSAYDAAGNESGVSVNISATTDNSSGQYTAPTIPTAHPRIYFTPEILNDVKTKVAPGGPMYSVYQNIKNNADLYVNDPLSMKYYRQGGMMITYAFLYMIEGDTKYSDAAKQFINDSMSKYSSQSFNSFGGHQRKIAITYDWIYDTLSEAERVSLTDYMILVSENELGLMPIYKQKSNGNNPTIQGLNNLYAAIAIHGDEYRDDEALTLLRDFGEFFEENTINQMNKMWGEKGGEVSGRSYSTFNFINRLPFLIELWRVLTDGTRDFFKTANFMKNFSYWDAMTWRPDDYHIKNGAYFYYVASESFYFRYVYSLLANRLNDPLAQYIAENAIASRWQDDWRYILWYNPSITSETYQSYPKDALFDGTGTVISRTGWDIGSYSGPSDNTYVSFQSGPWWIYHQNYDQNTFTIYHKGGLLTDGGKNHATNLRNTIVIDDEDQITNKGSDGTSILDNWKNYGIGTDSEIAKVKRYEANESYLYALGDASKAYNPSKLSHFVREFIFLKPNYFVIFDRVSTTDTSYSKKYLLQSINVPKVGGVTPPDGTNTYTTDLIQIDRGGTPSNNPNMNGRLFSKTLLPASNRITVVGSGQTQNFDKKEPVRWRMEIEPTNPQLNDFFLHVMQVGDSDTLPSMTPTTLITADTMKGTLINDSTTPQIVLFSSDPQGADVTTVTYNANYSSTKTGTHLLLDIQPGTYDIYKNGIKIHSDIGASTQGVLTFTSSGGSTFQITQTGTTPPPPTLQADLNSDGTVNSLDWSIMNNAWNTNDATADINNDGIVNTIDWSVMNGEWGA